MKIKSNLIVKFLAVLLLLVMFSEASFAQTYYISFARGRSSATVSGILSNTSS